MTPKIDISWSHFLDLCHQPPPVPASPPGFTRYDVRHRRKMLRSKFSASVESFLSSSSSSSSVSGDHGYLEAEQIHPIARRPFFRRSFPSLAKTYTPDTSLRHPSPSPRALQKQQEQLISMGYSKVFTLGYLSATGAFQLSG